MYLEKVLEILNHSIIITPVIKAADRCWI